MLSPNRGCMSDVKVAKYNVETGEYKGSPTLTIWEVGTDGVLNKFPVITFGKKKAKAIIAVIDIIKNFAEGEDK